MDPALLGGPFASCFDVGADTGAFGEAALEAWPDCQVVSFEPLHQAPSVVLEHNERWLWYDIALGAATDVKVMNRCVFSPSSSLLPMADLHRQAFPYSDGSDGEKVVRVLRLDTFANLIHAPALLKIDTQGYEFEVLRGAGDALARFATVVVEVNHAELYHGAPRPEELYGPLVNAGFRHARRVDEMRHPETNQLLQSDELWVKA